MLQIKRSIRAGRRSSPLEWIPRTPTSQGPIKYRIYLSKTRSVTRTHEKMAYFDVMVKIHKKFRNRHLVYSDQLAYHGGDFIRCVKTF